MQEDDRIKPHTPEQIEFLRRAMIDAQAQYRCALLRNRILQKGSVPAIQVELWWTRLGRELRTIRMSLRKAMEVR